jgi:hypothetical protein
MTTCVLLMRNAVLRARELYADVRSSAWVENAAELKTVLLRPAPRLAVLRQLMSRHPGSAQRLELLDSTDGMFRFTGWDGFSTGFALALMGVSMFFITIWLPYSPALALTFVLPLLTATPLVVSVTGIGMWRATFLALIRGHVPPSVFPTATACALGALVGGLLPTAMSMVTIAIHGGQLLDAAQASAASVVMIGALLCLAFLLLATLALMAFLRWLVATAECWLTTGPAHPRTKFIICVSIACVVATLAIVFGPQGVVIAAYEIYKDWNTSRYDGLTTIFFFTSSFAWVLPFGPALWLACLAIWALPLSAGLLPRRHAIGTWAFVAAAAAAPWPLSPPKFRLGRAATIGISGGIAAVLLSAVLHGHGLTGKEALPGILHRLLTGALAQGVTAVVAVAAIPLLAIPHAMFACWIAGGTYVVFELLRLNVAEGLPLILAMQLVLPVVLFDGALFALLCASAAWLLLAPLRRLITVR